MKSMAGGEAISPEALVNACLDQLCMFDVSEVTLKELIDYARKWGNMEFSDSSKAAEAERNVIAILQLIVASKEYQLA